MTIAALRVERLFLVLRTFGNVGEVSSPSEPIRWGLCPRTPGEFLPRRRTTEGTLIFGLRLAAFHAGDAHGERCGHQTIEVAVEDA